MTGVRDRLEGLWAGALDLRTLRYELQNDPDVLAALTVEEIDLLYRSAQLGRYSLTELCRVVERFQTTRTKENDDEPEPGA